jgi:hypothetical protein
VPIMYVGDGEGGMKSCVVLEPITILFPEGKRESTVPETVI